MDPAVIQPLTQLSHVGISIGLFIRVRVVGTRDTSGIGAIWTVSQLCTMQCKLNIVPVACKPLPLQDHLQA